MGYSNLRVTHADDLHDSRVVIKRGTTPNASCFTGGFYKAPANGATVDSLQPLDLEWDNTCLDTANVDIYVLAPGSHLITPHIWNNIPFSPGKYTLQLQPRWWNASSSQSLQISIVPAHSIIGTNILPAGPVITATYKPPADGKIPDIANPSANLKGANKSLSPGKAAAAALIPLLFVFAIAFGYLRHQRRSTNAKSRRFSQALDQRMSTISSDWRSVSAAGASAAIRNSMAASGSRSSRPDSFAFASGGDGYGEKTTRTGTGVGPRAPFAAAAFAAERASRTSRVSFATTEHPRTSRSSSAFADSNSRPSTDSAPRRGGHGKFQAPLPPVPSALRATVASSVYPDSVQDMELVPTYSGAKGVNSPTMSPRQAQGPLTLTPEDILARMNGNNASGGSQTNTDAEEEMNEVMPALSMMRTGLEPSTPTSASHQYASYDDYLLPPTPPAPTHAKLTPSPLSSPFGESPMSGAAMMSPDDMLRAYAERQRSPPPVHSPPSSFRAMDSASSNGGSPQKKGRKLSFRRGPFSKEKDDKEKRLMIGKPLPILVPSDSATSTNGSLYSLQTRHGHDSAEGDETNVGVAN